MSRGRSKQAKVLDDGEVRKLLNEIDRTSKQPKRDRAMVLLSFKAGLRAVEIASLTWDMVTRSTGYIDNAIELPNSASKGKNGGRVIPMSVNLRVALEEWQNETELTSPEDPIVVSQRGGAMSAEAVTVWFHRLYTRCGVRGSSHSGRRTFITKLARNVEKAGGSLRDVQALAGHASLVTTQRYIDCDSAAQRNLVEFA